MAYGISLQDLLQAAPTESDVAEASVVTITNGSIGRLLVSYIVETVKGELASGSSTYSVVPLCGLDNGNNLPGVDLQLEIDRLVASGVSPDKIIWFSLGTEAYGRGTVYTGSVSCSVGDIGGIGIIATGTGGILSASVITSSGEVIGVGELNGSGGLLESHIVTSAGDISGVGTVVGGGLGNISLVSVTSSTYEIAGIGISIGASSVTDTASIVSSVGIIAGSGISVGVADVGGVTSVTYVSDLTGVGPAGMAGAGTLAGELVSSSVGSVASNAAPYSTITLTNFYEPVLGISSVTAALSTAGVGTITGVGITTIGKGSISGVSGATAVATIGSNADPYSSILFNNFT